MHLGNIEDWGKRIKRNIVNKKEREREREREEVPWQNCYLKRSFDKFKHYDSQMNKRCS